MDILQKMSTMGSTDKDAAETAPHLPIKIVTHDGGYFSVLESDKTTKHGKCVKMYDSGKVQYTCEYNNGKIHGRYVEYYDMLDELENEQPIYRIIEYNMGKKNGGYVTYDKSGHLGESRKYSSGLLHGTYLVTDDNGFQTMILYIKGIPAHMYVKRPEHAIELQITL